VRNEELDFVLVMAPMRDCLSMLDAEAAIHQWPPPMQLSITRLLTTPLLPGRELVEHTGKCFRSAALSFLGDPWSAGAAAPAFAVAW
jgi:hypothetical protein